ncbi:MAG TPA: deoxyribose-phosphate aldolase [Candidatus Acidoferrales bacterium]|nr:deoxyribose-phosphate aldolase [Candidatus Acidoferrales bacterium]
MAAQNIASLIDHTLLKPEATAAQIRQLCEEALHYKFATVCVNPCYVPLAAELVRGSTVKVCSVAGFPLGASTTDAKIFEAQEAIAQGAREIDMVMNVGALKSGDDGAVEADIRGVVEACHRGKAICKVILENVLLTDAEKVRACKLAKNAGADYVKTSTGFGAGGATVEDVALMRATVGPKKGVKAAGGIRSYEDAMKMIAAGATRIGASASVKIMQQAREANA